jgi:hypothetical protein
MGMTTNELLLARTADHMAIPADSGIGRLTRSHLFTALKMAGCRSDERAWAWVALCDRAREQHLYAAQRAHKELLASSTVTFRSIA